MNRADGVPFLPTESLAEGKKIVINAVRSHPSPRACLKMGRGSAAGEFWVGQGGERRGRPPAVCSARTNAVQAGKTRRPEGSGGKGPLAALLVGHRPLRVCFLRAPCQSNPSLPNRTLPHFQTGSKSSTVDPCAGLLSLRTREPIFRASVAGDDLPVDRGDELPRALDLSTR